MLRHSNCRPVPTPEDAACVPESIMPSPDVPESQLLCVMPILACAGNVLSAAVLGTSALYAAQSMLVFGFAAAALEAAFSNGVVKRMGGSAN